MAKDSAVIEARPPWEDFQEQPQRPPWEDFQPPTTEPPPVPTIPRVIIPPPGAGDPKRNLAPSPDPTTTKPSQMGSVMPEWVDATTEKALRIADELRREMQQRGQDLTVEKAATQGLIGMKRGVESSIPRQMGGVIEMVSGLNKALNEHPIFKYTPAAWMNFVNLIPGAEKYLQETGQIMQEQAAQAGQPLTELSQGMGAGQDIADLGDTATSMAPAVAGTMFGGIPGAAIAAGMQSAGGTFADAAPFYDEATGDRSNAVLPAAASGLVTTLVTMGFGKTGKGFEESVMNAIKTKTVPAGFSGWFSEVAGNFGFEAAEEATDQAWQSVIAKVSYRPDITLEEAAKEVVKAGMAGGLLTIPASGVGGLARVYEAQAAKRAEQDQQAATDLAKMQQTEQAANKATATTATTADPNAPSDADILKQVAPVLDHAELKRLEEALRGNQLAPTRASSVNPAQPGGPAAAPAAQVSQPISRTVPAPAPTATAAAPAGTATAPPVAAAPAAQAEAAKPVAEPLPPTAAPKRAPRRADIEDMDAIEAAIAEQATTAAIEQEVTPHAQEMQKRRQAQVTQAPAPKPTPLRPGETRALPGVRPDDPLTIRDVTEAINEVGENPAALAQSLLLEENVTREVMRRLRPQIDMVKQLAAKEGIDPASLNWRHDDQLGARDAQGNFRLGEAYFDRATGKIVVNLAAKSAQTPSKIRAILREESAHRLLETDDGQREVQAWAQQYLTPEIEQSLSRYRRKGMTEEEWRNVAANEFIAKLAREGSKLWTELVEKVKAWAASKGLVNLTAEEAGRAILKAARRRTQENRGKAMVERNKELEVDRPRDLLDDLQEVASSIDIGWLKEARPDWKPTGAARQLFVKGGRTRADVALNGLKHEPKFRGKYDDITKADELIDAVDAASRGRQGWRADRARENRMMAEMAKEQMAADKFTRAQAEKFARESQLPGRHQQPLAVAEDLNVGDTFDLNGHPMTVLDLQFDEDGNVTYVTLSNGKTYGVQVVDGNTVLQIDKGTLTKANADDAATEPGYVDAPFSLEDIDDLYKIANQEYGKQFSELNKAQQDRVFNLLANGVRRRVSPNSDEGRQPVAGGESNAAATAGPAADQVQPAPAQAGKLPQLTPAQVRELQTKAAEKLAIARERGNTQRAVGITRVWTYLDRFLTSPELANRAIGMMQNVQQELINAWQNNSVDLAGKRMYGTDLANQLHASEEELTRIIKALFPDKTIDEMMATGRPWTVPNIDDVMFSLEDDIGAIAADNNQLASDRFQARLKGDAKAVAEIDRKIKELNDRLAKLMDENKPGFDRSGKAQDDGSTSPPPMDPVDQPGPQPQAVMADVLSATNGLENEDAGGFKAAIIKNLIWLRRLASNLPEISLTGVKARIAAEFKRGYRLMREATNEAHRKTIERINNVLEPLEKLPRQVIDPNLLRRWHQIYVEIGKLRQQYEVKPSEALAKQIATLDAKRVALQKRLESNPFYLFRSTVILRDLWYRGTFLKTPQGEPLKLPGDLDPEFVRSEIGRISALIARSPHKAAIETAIERHTVLMGELQAELEKAGELIPDEMKNPLYFPHHVLQYWSDAIDHVRTTAEQDFRRYLMTPTGSANMIQTDYLKAMYKHVAEVEVHNSHAAIVEKFWRKPYDIYDRVAQEVAARNGGQLPRGWMMEDKNLPTGYKVFWPEQLKLPVSHVLDRAVLGELIGKSLGDGELKAELEASGINLGDMAERIIEMMGNKLNTKPWIIPSEIADAIQNLVNRQQATAKQLAARRDMPRTLQRPMNWLQLPTQFWKMNTLFAPWHYVRYEFTNTATDVIDKMLGLDPGMMRYLPQAYRELVAEARGEEVSADLAAARKNGVMSGVTALEMQDLVKQPEFEFLATDMERLWNRIKRGAGQVGSLGIPALLTRGAAGNTMEMSMFRESLFRYAKFLADVKRMQNGKRPVYGGAYWKDIEALGSIYAKAAEINMKTFGDYHSLSLAGDFLRRYVIPFWSWSEVNARYHVNLIRNLYDGLTGKMGGGQQARAAVTVIGRLVLFRALLEAWNRVGGVMAGLWDDDDELEKTLSAEDRRRTHILLGKDERGRTRLMYAPSALADAMKFVGGQAFSGLAMEYFTGKISFHQFMRDAAKQVPIEAANNFAQGINPIFKGAYMAVAGKDPFPDVFYQRQIRRDDLAWVIASTVGDRNAALIMRTYLDKDFYNTRDVGEYLTQLILQVRRRDPEQWSYYEVRELAANWLWENKQRRYSPNSENPEMVIARNLRKAIYLGDMEGAMRFYTRLAAPESEGGFGYTREQFRAAIMSQDPLSGIPKEDRPDFLASLPVRDREAVELAYRYYARLQSAKGDERKLFGSKRTADRWQPDAEAMREVISERERMTPVDVRERGRQIMEESTQPKAQRATPVPSFY